MIIWLNNLILRLNLLSFYTSRVTIIFNNIRLFTETTDDYSKKKPKITFYLLRFLIILITLIKSITCFHIHLIYNKEDKTSYSKQKKRLSLR